MFKKISLVLFSLVLLLSFSKSAFAGGVASVNGQYINVSLSENSRVYLYNGDTYDYIDEDANSGLSYDIPHAWQSNNGHYAMQFTPNAAFCSSHIYNDCTTNLVWNFEYWVLNGQAYLTDPTPQQTGTGIFFPRHQGTNESTANELVGSVASATVGTFGNFGSITATVIGVILAFILIRFIISLFYGTDPEKNKEVK